MTICSREEARHFIFREARMQDEARYDDWEALWTDDGVYWVPANGEDLDPNHVVSIIFDNRARISSRIRQLNSGKRHAQMPLSRLRRVINNFEFEESASDEMNVACNFILVEVRRGTQRIWAGRTKYVLRTNADGIRMAKKTVVLVNNEFPIDTLAFLI